MIQSERPSRRAVAPSRVRPRGEHLAVGEGHQLTLWRVADEEEPVERTGLVYLGDEVIEDLLACGRLHLHHFGPPGELSAASEQLHRVEGKGTIDVNVNAPRGTTVKAGSEGMFKDVNLNRQFSMPRADERGASGGGEE
jgi:hypothetical protein